MTQITLTPEQSALLHQAVGPVVLVDAAGKQVAQLTPKASHFTPEELAEMEQRIGRDNGPYLTTAELLAKLQAMEHA